jgi:hypothetical protein
MSALRTACKGKELGGGMNEHGSIKPQMDATDGRGLPKLEKDGLILGL